MSPRSRLATRAGDCVRRRAARLVGLRPSPTPTPTVREGVNVLLARAEEVQKVHAHVVVGLADTQRDESFADCSAGGTAARVVGGGCLRRLWASS